MTKEDMDTSQHKKPLNQKTAGDVDPSFGANGLAEVKSPEFLVAEAATRDPTSHLERKTYAIYRDHYAHLQWMVRLLEDGTLDTNFGDAGYVQLPHDYSRSLLKVSQFVFLDSENIIVFGAVEVQRQNRWVSTPAAACVTAKGFIDTSFGTEGFIIFDLPIPSDPSATKTPVDKIEKASQTQLSYRPAPPEHTSLNPFVATKRDDGTLVFVGSIRENSTHLASYAFKINPDGTFDEGFGKRKGVVLIEDHTTSSPILPDCEHSDVDRSGGFVLTWIDAKRDTAVVRYNAQGHPDLVFGQSGVVLISSPYGFGNHMRDVKAMDDGKVMVLASYFNDRFMGDQRPAVIQLMPTGTPDQDFNSGQPAIIDLGEFAFMSYGLTIDDDKRILVHGLARTPLIQKGCVSRLLPDGRLDEDYGVQGTAILEGFGEVFMGGSYPGGKLLATTISNTYPNVHIIRLMG